MPERLPAVGDVVRVIAAGIVVDEEVEVAERPRLEERRCHVSLGFVHVVLQSVR